MNLKSFQITQSEKYLSPVVAKTAHANHRLPIYGSNQLHYKLNQTADFGIKKNYWHLHVACASRVGKIISNKKNRLTIKKARPFRLTWHFIATRKNIFYRF